jgi:hypothetical protein
MPEVVEPSTGDGEAAETIQPSGPEKVEMVDSTARELSQAEDSGRKTKDPDNMPESLPRQGSPAEPERAEVSMVKANPVEAPKVEVENAEDNTEKSVSGDANGTLNEEPELTTQYVEQTSEMPPAQDDKTNVKSDTLEEETKEEISGVDEVPFWLEEALAEESQEIHVDDIDMVPVPLDTAEKQATVKSVEVVLDSTEMHAREPSVLAEVGGGTKSDIGKDQSQIESDPSKEENAATKTTSKRVKTLEEGLMAIKVDMGTGLTVESEPCSEPSTTEAVEMKIDDNPESETVVASMPTKPESKNENNAKLAIVVTTSSESADVQKEASTPELPENVAIELESLRRELQLASQEKSELQKRLAEREKELMASKHQIEIMEHEREKMQGDKEDQLIKIPEVDDMLIQTLMKEAQEVEGLRTKAIEYEFLKSELEEAKLALASLMGESIDVSHRKVEKGMSDNANSDIETKLKEKDEVISFLQKELERHKMGEKAPPQMDFTALNATLARFAEELTSAKQELEEAQKKISMSA